MPDDIPTVADVQTLLVTILAGATDGDDRRWSKLVQVEKRAMTLDPRSNWTVAAVGPDDAAAIDQAVALVRAQVPFVR